MSKMEKKQLKKKPEKWACSEGCDVTSSICKHIEKSLPQISDYRLARVDTSTFSMDVFKAYRPEFDLSEFVDYVRSYGFVDPWDIELITAKYFYGMSYRQIERDFGYVSFKTAQRRLKHLHSLMLERGLTPKGKK